MTDHLKKRKIKRPVLRYFGGKFMIAPWIISHFPQHRIYVEPFGGAASVLLQKEKSYSEVYNDLDDSVYNLFMCLREVDLSFQLKQVLASTPYSRREFELAHVFHPNPIENARRLIIRSLMGFGASSSVNINSKTGFRSNSNRRGTTPAHDWANYPVYLSQFQKRLSGVIIENKDAKDVMLDHDSEETLHYLDPPYPHTTRRGGRYNHEMTDNEHLELVEFLQKLKGHVVVSGYDCEIYDRLGWRKEYKKTFADGARERTEILWIK